MFLGTNPDAYHPPRKKRDFFEGWYIKVTDRAYRRSLAIIPGINLNKSGKHSHAFIQVLDSQGPTAFAMRYPKQEFRTLPGQFDISVAQNSFSARQLNLAICGQRRLAGRLTFDELRSWPAWGPLRGSMGILSQLPFLECYAQVITLNGRCEGTLLLDDETLDFSGGTVYMEKNWGRRFPRSWIWLQGNCFGNNQISVTASVARVPFPGGIGGITGFIVGVALGERFLSFTSYNGARLRLMQGHHEPTLICERKGYKLLLQARSKPELFAGLLIPKDGRMVYGVMESLSAELALTVFKNGELLYNGTSHAAGVEYGGSWKKLFR